MNEDERGITPANVTSMTVQQLSPDGQVGITIERGNGDSVQTMQLSVQERLSLTGLLQMPIGDTIHLSFVELGERP